MTSSKAETGQSDQASSLLIQQAEAAVAANAEPEDPLSPTSTDSQGISRTSTRRAPHQEATRADESDKFPDIEDVPPPPYESKKYGQLSFDQMGLDTGAKLANDGRVNINIRQRHGSLTSLLAPALRNQLELDKKHPEPEPPIAIPPGLAKGAGDLPPPPMNVVIQIVGSRGDVQPFIALGQELKNKYGHRVRIATHPTFRDFVTENGLEFFSIGGDPAELMAFMVKNPGLMPGFDAMRNGDIGKRRKGIHEMILGCWRSCIEAGDGTGIEASDSLLDDRSFDSAVSLSGDATSKPFVADAIIANPPSFAHVHIAEKLGIPLHLMFTMPWSPTQAFPHPLANIQSSECDPTITNFLTYAMIDMMTWQGLGDVINRFREKTLGLEPISIMWAPGMASRLRVPWTYCWSPALIPKPADWGNYIDISGFYFLNLASDYTPADDLAAFLAAGPPPIYIGFGSIVVDDPNAMTKMIFEAVKKTGARALVSKGWGGIGADELGIPEGVFMLGNVPHDWLFKHVSCVVHHGGAGTSAAGITSGRPTVVVPFFGDQPFWGAMIARAGAGPHPVPYKDMTADKLAEAIEEALKPESLERAQELSQKIKQENGAEEGAKSFHKHLQLNSLRCVLDPRLAAVWRIKRTDIHISALAATVLSNEGLLSFSDLKLYRPREYDTDDGPWEPLTGAAAALIGTMGNMMMGVADFPVEMLKALRIASNQSSKEKRESKPGTPTSTTPRQGRSPVRSASMASLQSPTESSAKGEELALEKTSSDHSAEEPLGNHRTALRTLSHHSSHHRSRSKHESPTRRESAGTGQMSLESMIDGSKGVSRIVTAGMKSPMDFTMALAKGFHNAPKLYGDDTVRKSERITGVGSGLKAAGKEFQYGFYDGITGVITQPIKGAEKEGAAGFVKGAAKGLGGLILKPAAGIWGLPGYATKGVYAEIKKHFGSSVQNYIIAARTSQGYAEWKESSPEQRVLIVSAFRARQDEIKKKGHQPKKEKETSKETPKKPEDKHHNTAGDMIAHFKQTRHMSFDERKKMADEKQQHKKLQKNVTRHSSLRQEDHEHLKVAHTIPLGTDEEFENAITRSITETSKGNPEEDAKIESALRASLKELRESQVEQGIDQSAVASPLETGTKSQSDSPQEAGDHDLDEAIRRSIAETSTPKPQGHDSGFNSDEDSEMKKALEESRRTSKCPFLRHNPKTSAAAKSPHELSANGADEKEGTANVAEDDEEFKRAVAESSKSHQDQQNTLAKQTSEDAAVLEHVKRQSLLEGEHRKKIAELETQHRKMIADMEEAHRKSIAAADKEEK